MSGSLSQQWSDQRFRRDLITVLRAWNRAALAGSAVDQRIAARLLMQVCTPSAAELSETAQQTIERLLDFPSHRLAVYGSLAPGKSNHYMMAGMKGSWRRATLRGSLRNEGWGAGLGFPGFLWDGTPAPVAAQVFSSTELPRHWERLDEFEGPEYRRIVVPVEVESEAVQVCNVYELTSSNQSTGIE